MQFKKTALVLGGLALGSSVVLAEGLTPSHLGFVSGPPEVVKGYFFQWRPTPPQCLLTEVRTKKVIQERYPNRSGICPQIEPIMEE